MRRPKKKKQIERIEEIVHRERKKKERSRDVTLGKMGKLREITS
jgi:hypothetical protein